MKILIILVITISLVVCEISEGDCIENYLSNQSSNFLPDDVKACANIIIKTKADFKRIVFDRLNPEENKTCIIQALDDFRITDWHLKGLANHDKNETDPDDYDYALDRTIELLLNPPMIPVFCGNYERLNRMFDRLFDKKKQGPKFHRECDLKYLIKIKAIDPSDYGINMSALSKATCDENKSAIELDDHKTRFPSIVRIFDLPTEKVVDCLVPKLAKKKIVERFFMFMVVSTFKIPDEKFQEVQLEFVDWLTSYSKIYLECFKETF